MSKTWLEENHKSCRRCGACCLTVGRTFWRNGDFVGCYPLELLAEQTESVDDGLPCEMLYVIAGVAHCRIECQYVREFKPEACREYPDGEPCHYYQKETT